MAVFTKVKIRERQTKHTGNNPQNILGGGLNMADENVLKTITKPRSFGNIARKGVSVFAGLAVARIVNTRLSTMIPNIGPVSGATLGGLATTGLTLWATRSFTNSGSMLRDVGEMATIGAGAYTLGSLLGDIARVSNISLGPLAEPISVLTGQEQVGGA